MKELRNSWFYSIQWIVAAVVVGLCSGLLGTVFHHATEIAGELRNEYSWLLYLMPFAGIAIVYLYKVLKTEGMSTNTVLDGIGKGTRISPMLFPSIFIATCLTHLTGGSAGREGAALQIGGSVAQLFSDLFKLDDKERRMMVPCGMAGLFSALFGTPVTAALFTVMISHVGLSFFEAFLPAMISSVAAYALALLLGVTPTHFEVAFVTADAMFYLRALLFSILLALVAVLFCWCNHKAGHLFKKYFSNPYVRVVCGSLIIIGLTLLSGGTRHNGTGMGIITKAIEAGEAYPADFLLKILFTAITLGCGFKGGEVVPSFFVGATFGAFVGPLLGIPASMAASMGLIGVFCGCTNALAPSIILAVELFGGQCLPVYALVCAVSYQLSGRYSFYESQKIMDDQFLQFTGE